MHVLLFTPTFTACSLLLRSIFTTHMVHHVCIHTNGGIGICLRSFKIFLSSRNSPGSAMIVGPKDQSTSPRFAAAAGRRLLRLEGGGSSLRQLRRLHNTASASATAAAAGWRAVGAC